MEISAGNIGKLTKRHFLAQPYALPWNGVFFMYAAQVAFVEFVKKTENCKKELVTTAYKLYYISR